jgi:hypothetical protein
MKEQHNLSGIYFRFKNPETGLMENRCFEDLPKETQEDMIIGRPDTWLRSMVMTLANTLYEVAEKIQIYKS